MGLYGEQTLAPEHREAFFLFGSLRIADAVGVPEKNHFFQDDDDLLRLSSRSTEVLSLAVSCGYWCHELTVDTEFQSPKEHHHVR